MIARRANAAVNAATAVVAAVRLLGAPTLLSAVSLVEAALQRCAFPQAREHRELRLVAVQAHLVALLQQTRLDSMLGASAATVSSFEPAG